MSKSPSFDIPLKKRKVIISINDKDGCQFVQCKRTKKCRLSKEAHHKLPLCCYKHFCVCKVFQKGVAICCSLFNQLRHNVAFKFWPILIRCHLYLFRSWFSYWQLLNLNGLNFVPTIGAQWLLHKDHKLSRFKVSRNLLYKLNLFL